MADDFHAFTVTDHQKNPLEELIILWITRALSEISLGSVCDLYRCFLNIESPKNNDEIRLGRLEIRELPWEPNFFIAVGVLPVELLSYEVSIGSSKN